MENFRFQNPTKIIFGEGAISLLPQEITPERRIMLCLGQGSARTNGVYEEVKKALANYDTVEFWGIEPNPDYDTAMQAVEIARQKNINFILAVGGGSVIDAVKFIAHAIPYRGEAWDLVTNTELIKESTPFGTVLTTPATGSEMNHRGVLSRRQTQEKVSFISPLSFPQFSILDPNVIRTIPRKQIANGIVDAFMHVMEQYMTYPAGNVLMDRWAEGILLSLIELGPKTISGVYDREVMANFMLCTTMALNGFIGMGVPQDWTAHRIGYELTILYGLDHAETLAVLYPSILRVLKEQKREKLIQYARRVWNIATDNKEQCVNEVICRTENFFREMGLRTKLSEYNIPQEAIETIYLRLKAKGAIYGEQQNVTPEVAKEIYRQSF